jgi:YbbR domain-containing protein
MRRLVAFVIRNWPLKLAAILLAAFLYAGLALSQSAQVWPGSVPIVPLKLPTSAVLLSNLPPVTRISYFAPAEVAQRLTSSSFTATVDLSNAQIQPGNPFVTVQVDVRATDPRVTVLDFDPPSIRVQLDPLVTKTVPVQVDHGQVPLGLEIRDPVLSVTNAVVTGPESYVKGVTAVLARVLIQPSGIDVDQTVDLVAVDVRGEVVGPVDVEPSTVHVQISVGSGIKSKTLPVNAVVAGTPAVGFEIVSVTVQPLTVSVEGDADALALLSKVDTSPISISNAVADVTQTVSLVLPQGVSVLAGNTVTVNVILQAVAETRAYTAGPVLSGARDDRTYTLSTDTVVVTLGGTVAALDALDARSFVVILDVDGLGPGPHAVKVRVSLPADIQAVAVSPPEVTVTITLNAAPAPAPSGP